MPPGETLITDIAASTSTNILYSAAGNIVRIWDLRKYVSTAIFPFPAMNMNAYFIVYFEDTENTYKGGDFR